MLTGRVRWLQAGLLPLILLAVCQVGCTGQSHIAEEVGKARKPIPAKPGDEPYQTAIRNYLVRHLPDPAVEDVKWYKPVEQRDGKGGVNINVKFVYREKMPGSTLKVERTHIFQYNSTKGEVLDLGGTKK